MAYATARTATKTVMSRTELTYEARLSNELEWAMAESDAFFQESGKVHETLKRVTRRLTELGIPHAVVGGLALFKHGFRRFTEDVDLLVTADGLKRLHAELEGRGYLPSFRGSKQLRDTESKVKIDFLTTGQYPGEGKVIPIAFPDPSDVAADMGGVPYVRLPVLIELKLASGMTKADRMKDLTDILELIKLTNLPENYVEQLHPFVREKFSELWRIAHPKSKRYMTIWRNKFLTVHTNSFDEMIESLSGAVETLKAMRADGVMFDPEGGTADDYVHLYTTDPIVARKYDMHDEADFWGDDERGDKSESEPPHNTDK